MYNLFEYTLNPCLTPSSNAAKGPSEWQTIDACIKGYNISVWLNGKLIQDNIEIPEGKKRIGTGTEFGCFVTDGFTNDIEKPNEPSDYFNRVFKTKDSVL